MNCEQPILQQNCDQKNQQQYWKSESYLCNMTKELPLSNGIQQIKIEIDFILFAGKLCRFPNNLNNAM